MARLREFVDKPHKVVGGPRPDQVEPVRALHAYAQLICAQFDLDAVTTFTDTWFADPRSRSKDG